MKNLSRLTVVLLGALAVAGGQQQPAALEQQIEKEREPYRISYSKRLIICCTFLMASTSHGRSMHPAVAAVL